MTKICWYSNLLVNWLPALVVPWVSCWDCQTLIHVTMEQPDHIPSGQKTWSKKVKLLGECTGL